MNEEPYRNSINTRLGLRLRVRHLFCDSNRLAAGLAGFGAFLQKRTLMKRLYLDPSFHLVFKR
jgi:hypothetical protein